MYNKIIIKKTATPCADLTARGVAFFMSVFSACTDLTSLFHLAHHSAQRISNFRYFFAFYDTARANSLPYL